MNYTEAKNLTRILALDYGERRIGLALSDSMKIIAKPYKTIENISVKKVLETLNEIIQDQSVEKIVVGIPITLKNRNSRQTEIVNVFIDMLNDKLSIPIIPYDERLTSVSAKRSLILQGIETGRNKGEVDMTAAAIFLQNYLDENSNSKE